MPHRHQTNHACHVAAVLLTSWFGIAPISSTADAADAVVPITSDPSHKIRFDNGRVRMYEVVLQKGEATLAHEHLVDNLAVIFSTGEITNEPVGGKPVILKTTPGHILFGSTAKSPYSHRSLPAVIPTFM